MWARMKRGVAPLFLRPSFFFPISRYLASLVASSNGFDVMHHVCCLH